MTIDDIVISYIGGLNSTQINYIWSNWDGVDYLKVNGIKSYTILIILDKLAFGQDVEFIRKVFLVISFHNQQIK